MLEKLKYSDECQPPRRKPRLAPLEASEILVTVEFAELIPEPDHHAALGERRAGDPSGLGWDLANRFWMKAQGYLHKQNINSGFRRQYQTYLKVRGRWVYLYRAIDRDGHLVDTMLSEHRDMAAAQAFFRSAKAITGITPERVTTDGHGSYPRAIRSTLGRQVMHRTSAYKNNRLEQDHRGVKGRTRCMRGFKSFASAGRFCRSHDELRDFLRPRARHNQIVPAGRRRLFHLRRATAALAILEAA